MSTIFVFSNVTDAGAVQGISRNGYILAPDSVHKFDTALRIRSYTRNRIIFGGMNY